MKMIVYIRALWRIALARWNTRFFDWSGKKLHFVPLYSNSNESKGELVPPVMDRPTLCGNYIDGPGDGTTQNDIVSCLPCAVAIELDRQRWVFKNQQNLKTEDGMTWCTTCGDVMQMGEYNRPYPCHCPQSILTRLKDVVLSKIR